VLPFNPHYKHNKLRAEMSSFVTQCDVSLWNSYSITVFEIWK